MHLRCPACKNKVLNVETIYYDLLSSDCVDYDKYTCTICRFEFLVKR